MFFMFLILNIILVCFSSSLAFTSVLNAKKLPKMLTKFNKDLPGDHNSFVRFLQIMLDNHRIYQKMIGTLLSF